MSELLQAQLRSRQRVVFLASSSYDWPKLISNDGLLTAMQAKTAIVQQRQRVRTRLAFRGTPLSCAVLALNVA